MFRLEMQGDRAEIEKWRQEMAAEARSLELHEWQGSRCGLSSALSRHVSRELVWKQSKWGLETVFR